MPKMCRFRSTYAWIKYHSGLCSPFIHSVVSNDSVSGQWRPWSDCADAQADLGLHCPFMSKDMFPHGAIQMMTQMQSDQSCCSLYGFLMICKLFMQTVKTLIRICSCQVDARICYSHMPYSWFWCSPWPVLTLTVLRLNSAEDRLILENFSLKIVFWHFMQIVSLGDNFHEVSKTIFREK